MGTDIYKEVFACDLDNLNINRELELEVLVVQILARLNKMLYHRGLYSSIYFYSFLHPPYKGVFPLSFESIVLYYFQGLVNFTNLLLFLILNHIESFT